MKTQQYDFVNVVERAQALGCHIPTGLAVLPRNFEQAKSREDLLHESTTPTVRVLFRETGIVETPLESEGENFPQISEKAFSEWIGPIIFVSLAALSQDPNILSVALGVISNYLTDFFKGVPVVGKVKLDIVVETKKRSYKRILYEGPVSGLDQLSTLVNEVESHD